MRPSVDRPPRGVEPIPHEVGHLVHAVWKERSALHVDQGFEIGPVLREETLDRVAELVEIEGGRDGVCRHSLATS